MRLKLSFFLAFLLFPLSSMALMEISGNFGYEKQVYGSTRQNDIVERTYSASWAWYMFSTTALELSYMRSETITDEHNEIAIDSSVSVIGLENVVKSDLYGIGIKQLLASRKARLVPAISLGYAKRFISDHTDYTIRDEATGRTYIIHGDRTRLRSDSTFGTFSLQFRLGAGLSLKASVQAVVKGTEFNRAGDDVKYLVGFSWFF